MHQQMLRRPEQAAVAAVAADVPAAMANAALAETVANSLLNTYRRQQGNPYAAFFYV
jgi:hypothetical protein